MTDIILTDLDSTLAHTMHRAHLAPAGGFKDGDWSEFSMACAGDSVIEGTAQLLRLLSKNYPIFIVSGRDVGAYSLTVTWLREVAKVPFQSLRLRTASDPHDNGLYKVQHVKFLRANGYEPILMLEDWPDVAAAVEELGVPTVCVNPRYHDNVMKTFAESYKDNPNA